MAAISWARRFPSRPMAPMAVFTTRASASVSERRMIKQASCITRYSAPLVRAISHSRYEGILSLNLAALRSGLFHVIIFFFFLTAPALAQPEPGSKVHARLVAEDKGVAPGGTVTVALEEKIAPGWHTYWKNPGDAGAPTEIEWTLPPGWKAGAIQWPRPKRLPVGPLMDYGYEGTPWLLIPLTAPAAAAPGAVTIKAKASWLVCEKICIPEYTTLTLNLNVGAGGHDPAVAKDFATARALLPVASPWKVSYALGANLD